MKRLTIEVTDVEMKALEGITTRLERYRAFIPVGLLPVVEKMELAIDKAETVDESKICSCKYCSPISC
jgi:hypothetical protein